MLSNACSQIHWGHFICVPLASFYHTALPLSHQVWAAQKWQRTGRKTRKADLALPPRATRTNTRSATRSPGPSYLSFWWSPYQGWRQCWILKDPRGWNPQTEKKHSKTYVFSDAKILLSWADTISGQVFKQTDCSWRHFPQQHMTWHMTTLETTWHQIYVWSASSVWGSATTSSPPWLCLILGAFAVLFFPWNFKGTPV